MYPLVPPQVASGVTFLVGVDAGGEDDRVEDVRMVEDVRTVEETRTDDEEETRLEEVTLPVHVPKAELQPVPQ